MTQFDVIVIGAGHAGTEAAAAAARCGARTALVTFEASKIGAMSCNPAIGGLGKGHLVREVDAFDGLIARATDAAGIHYRMLNRSKGSAVQGPRVQADRTLYAAAIQAMVAAQPGLQVVEAEAAALILSGDRVAGIELADGSTLDAPSVVLATGTFLSGRIFRGDIRAEGGRVGERAATRLGVQLRDLALPLARLKTGTPPRIDGRTIDWGALDEQPSDIDQWTMSAMTSRRMLPQLRCAITRTNSVTHDIIRASLDRSPLFSGAIGGQGPRYCPSIEDKIHRFADRDGHQIFLEPEGLNTHLVYPNGISTSLPDDVQDAMIRSVVGLERAVIETHGYAVEYDHVDPRALSSTLEYRATPGLFCAGQINGTTGYEEAAGQGLVAGINASAHALGRAPTILDRATSYLGVMIDDLILQGVTEPYRMLTARAEFRLRLRANNAETRLGAIAKAAGVLGEARRAHQAKHSEALAEVATALETRHSARQLIERGATLSSDGTVRPGSEWLRFPGVDPAHVLDSAVFDSAALDEALEDARYAPYLERQAAEVDALHLSDATTLTAIDDWSGIPGLSREMIERLSKAQPETLGAASRVRGVTPAALSAILLHSKKRKAA
ncbi:tRNA uridine-5-carboxymethylaminomethyl(34) synthesis enzyme MnmG [Sphingomonas sp. AX6]|uniref:tRNA uridine-5-carboxymethylaminomethyl(34) synthesis enzyme MnmG n=1 Tax=Sphingomonas sp. AX6 TaxID=2653171 RepID=UPI0012F0E96E|nr:tRNA uridine-5-carboxymethylaminomethyl(34) synthesis enzyme MnmG [Sphingomonas sp. AX6]VXC49461.1 glucose-inhibited cell-division protein [Sphingomonas sp. AX6]